MRTQRRPMHTALPIAGLGAAIALTWALWPAHLWPADPVAIPIPPPDPASPTRADSLAGSTAQSSAASAAAVRQVSSIPAPRAPDDFATYLERLVGLALITNRHVELGNTDAAEKSDREAQDVFSEMVQKVPDADEQALFTLAGLLSEDVTLAGRARRRVCVLTIAHGLSRRHERFSVLADRRHLDAFVSSLLGLVPQDEVLAGELGGELLTDRPYLGLAHEEQVLELLELSREQPFLSKVATGLLTTLWHNLEAQGVRSASELAALALLFKDEPNSAKRLAAFRQLLMGKDLRFRQLALEEVRRSGEPRLVRELALAVAEELDGEEALEVLTSLSASPVDLLPAFLALGHRDGRALERAYEQHLADDVDPSLRAELVSSAGFNRSPEGLALAKLAFWSDPDPNVRARALFVLTAFAPDTLGETAMNAALDDPAFANDPARLGSLVQALENFVQAGEVNAIDRLGQRLRAFPLQDVDRRALENILARALPGGRTSR